MLFAHAGAEIYGTDRPLLELAAGLKSRGHVLQVVLPAPGVLNAELARVPHVCDVHEITPRQRWLAHAFSLCAGLLSQRAMFVSAATRDPLRALRPSLLAKAVVGHNGNDIVRAQRSRRGALRAESGWYEPHCVVGMLGRVNGWKGQAALLACAARLVPGDEGLRFVGLVDASSGRTLQVDAIFVRSGAAPAP